MKTNLPDLNSDMHVVDEFVSAKALRQRAKLERRLLALGGRRVVWRDCEPHLTQLIAQGQPFTEPVRMRQGKPCRCHENAAALWAKDVDGTELATGYGLSDDGLWRQHSWVRKDNLLYETTERRDQYFGVVLGTVDALRFWFANWKVYHDPDSTAGMDRWAKQFPGLLPLIEECVANGFAELGQTSSLDSSSRPRQGRDKNR